MKEIKCLECENKEIWKIGKPRGKQQYQYLKNALALIDFIPYLLSGYSPIYLINFVNY